MAAMTMTVDVDVNGDDGASAEDAAAATLRVLRGEPTAEELAALVAVIAARAGLGGAAAKWPAASAWTDRSRYVRPHPRRASEGWRASAFPQ